MDKNLQLTKEYEKNLEDYRFYREKFTSWQLKNLTQRIKAEGIINKLKYSQL
jgi:hypothetical protein